MTLTDALTKDIKILNFDLKDEDELKAILKRRLTKKEFKFYGMKNDSISAEEIVKALDLNEKRYEEMNITVIKKINSEKVKNELTLKD